MPRFIRVATNGTTIIGPTMAAMAGPMKKYYPISENQKITTV